MSSTLAPEAVERAPRKPSGVTPPLIKVCECVIEGMCALKNDDEFFDRSVPQLQHLRRLVGRLEDEMVRRARKTREAIPVLRQAATIAEHAYHQESR